MTNRLVDTEIWKKDWFLELTDKQKLLTKFLFDNCDCAGFYKISRNLLKCFFNDPPTKEDFKKIKQVKFLKDDIIFIEDFALFQCKVNSFDELNPKNNAHLGVLKLLKKYNIYLSPSLAPRQPLTSPSLGAQEKEKEKEKEKDITSNKQIDTINNNNINKNFQKKIKNPYESPYIYTYQKEYKKVFNRSCYLLNNHRNKIIEIASSLNEEFETTLPIVFESLKKMNFEEIGVKPDNSWLLKDDNYTKVLEGMWEPQKEKIECWEL